ncbi:peptidoglycan/LPS O-acetylase OafA/YrhL [Rathayibacter sp. PhB93]|uniref:acyltransferase family protein n=1 Tax=unclassified Rathayibacter TaxID=2609250 RepID=UPI000F4A6E72|nr:MULTISPECIES: acyltransferase family protein [unclassified Rathayibacter]ROQ06246.1 peptidoglycan/LPS O-acetylase OafA/YrhL [Rathayibacter sp. PhB93]TDQ14003.1 peptidoglycan/LPS O-acetylase OafA/YrhL [Rathayibacter sp. PhB1]
MTYRALDSVRACAALLVLVAHVRQAFLVPAAETRLGPADSALYALTSLGHGAVIVFFVLSGFFVGGSVLSALSRDAFSWTRYLTSRLTRLWLVLIPALVLTAVLDAVGVAFLLDRPQYAPGGSAQVDGGILGALGNVVFLQPHLVRPFGTDQPLWSIGYEAGYYLLFPLLLVGLTRGSGRRRVLCAAAAVVVVFVLGPAGTGLFLAWLAGAAVAWRGAAATRFLARLGRKGTAASIVAVLLLVISAMSVDRLAKAGPDDLGWTTWATTIAAAALVVVLCHSEGTPGKSLDRLLRGGTWVSGFSVSLYATHVPVLMLLHALLFPPPSAWWQPSVASWAGVLALALLACAVGWAFGALTERRTEAVRAGVLGVVERLRRPRRAATGGG